MNQVIDDLYKFRHFTGHEASFWPAFLERATRLAGAQAGVLLFEGRESGTWKSMSVSPPGDATISLLGNMDSLIAGVASSAAASARGWSSRNVEGINGAGLVLLGVGLHQHQGHRARVFVFLLNGKSDEDLESTAALLKLVADTPAMYQRERKVRQAMHKARLFSQAFDIMVLLNGEKKFTAAAMTFVNEVASRYSCTRASLGWISAGYVRLEAISHMESFEKKMNIVQRLESAMEEAFDQDEEIVLPAPEDSTSVVRDHEVFCREQERKFMVSLPLRIDDAPAAVLSCEREERPFSESEIQGLRILCDQAARRLGDLKERDRWFGARIAAIARNEVAKLVGVEHTGAKLMGLMASALMLFLLLGGMQYRVEAPFVLRSNDVRYLPAPFEGYIDKVHVTIGEEVEKDEMLLSLDTRDLVLEESEAIANEARYTREAEKARAENMLGDMKIALALAEQAKSRLDLVRHHVDRANVKAPFSGIIVEGDLEELQGAAVKKGDILFKVSRLEKMYAELEVSERNIQELKEDAAGAVAFVSRPGVTFPITVERIEPVAISKEEGNIFILHCTFPEGVADWWRPGMSGMAKISVGKRNALWILTHRTVDFFRMLFWW